MLDTSRRSQSPDGFVFAFKAMGSVLPIAGASSFIGAQPGLSAARSSGVTGGPGARPAFRSHQSRRSAWIPGNHFLVAFGVLIVGMITGIDGSGFAGLPLTGSLSGALAPSVGIAACDARRDRPDGGRVDRRRYPDGLVVADRGGRLRARAGVHDRANRDAPRIRPAWRCRPISAVLIFH